MKIFDNFNNKEILEIRRLFIEFGVADADVLPATSNALEKSAKLVKNIWSAWAAGRNALPEIGKNPNPSTAMARSIKIEKKGIWHREIYSNDRQMEQMQNGCPRVEFDMKKTHPYGRKSRISKKGIPFLIVPFRWGTPNSKNSKRAHFANFIPQEEYETGANAKSLKGSWITGLKHPELNARGELIDRNKYQWESRLSSTSSWDKNANGMVKMKSIGNRKSGTYFTFRIISAQSNPSSWIYRKPEQKPIDIITAIENFAQPEVEKIIENGLRTDLGLLDK